MSWMTWVLFVGLVWIYSVCSSACENKPTIDMKSKSCLLNMPRHVVIADNFSGFFTVDLNQSLACILFLNVKSTSKNFWKHFPKMEEFVGDPVLLVTKEYIKLKKPLFFLTELCNITSLTHNETCKLKNLDLCQESSYDQTACKAKGENLKNKIIISMKNETCLNCDNPVKLAESTKEFEKLNTNEKGEISASAATEAMNKMADLATSINESSAELKFGEGVLGILVREADPEEVDEVSFGYTSPKDSVHIIENKHLLAQYSRAVSVPKEAFDNAVSLNISVPFVALLRFINLTLDEKNTTLLGNEVLAVEMGTRITNLTNRMNISFKNVEYEGIPSCHSWDGVGSQPNWTDNGCLTITNGSNITCMCSHLTFFAVLLAPPNTTIPVSDLKNLTIISQVGCGLSMFFLSIVLFMHCLLRKTKASSATKILIHLVLAMFLLNFTFLINNYVAKMKNSWGCKIMAALMHYFLLTTFTWFAVQAFHICLNLYQGGKIVIRHYILKVSITGWVLPSVVGIVLLVLGKYGESVIYTDNTEDDVTICWITDIYVHYIINIGYYALVFLFTFTTFIVILRWLFHLKTTKSGTSSAEIGKNRKSITVILGLCCTMGITWGFAFFAYGILRIPAYYIFTVLNSFQGLFLFIYYYNTSHSGEIISDQQSLTDTLQSSVQSSDNPYANYKK